MRYFALMLLLLLWGMSSDVIAEDVFGFKWRMSYAEAVNLNMGKLVKEDKLSYPHLNASTYKIENPKKPQGAKSIKLFFFNGELLSVTVEFPFKQSYKKYEDKRSGLIRFLESKYTGARRIDHLGKTLDFNIFSYTDGPDNKENIYNLERIIVMGTRMETETIGIYLLSVHYNFYGFDAASEYLEKKKDEQEFGDF